MKINDVIYRMQGEFQKGYEKINKINNFSKCTMIKYSKQNNKQKL